MKDRRVFLKQLATLTALASASPDVLPSVSRPSPKLKGPVKGAVLWCDAAGLIGPVLVEGDMDGHYDPEEPSARRKVLNFIDKCAQHGVTKLIPSGGSRLLVETAHARGIQVIPYLWFNDHGGNYVLHGWSVGDIEPALGTPEAKEVLNRHRPIWSNPYTELSMSDFAKENPASWARDRGRQEALQPGQKLGLSLALPEVRAYEVGRYLRMLKATGGDGVQVEFPSVNQDEKGVGIYGYEEPMVAAYQQKHRQSPFELPNDDPTWVRFRAEYVTTLLRELRVELKKKAPDALLTTTIIARERDEYVKVMQDWSAWIDQGLVDEFYLWFRTTSDLGQVERYTKQAADVIKGRCPLIAELSCYHPGSFQDPELMLEAARRARAYGADGVGIYRGHSVDQLDFWPVLKQMSEI